MSLKEQLSSAYSRVYKAVTSARGREVGLFLLFLAVSYVFWLLLTLNHEIQEDVEVPISIVDVPDSVTFISDVPGAVKVSVRDKGSVLIRHKMGGLKTMKLEWTDYASSNSKFMMGKVDLGARLRDYFGPSSQIVTVVPDSIKINYTTEPGRKVPVVVRADVHAALGCVVNGPLTIDTDSVTLFALNDLPLTLNSVETIPIVRSNLGDTSKITVRIDPIPGVRIIPDHVTITVPVEPLIARRQMASVVVKDIPAGKGLLTFPSKVEVSYLVPMSDYNSEPFDVKAYVSFDEAVRATTSKIPVRLSLIPELYRNVSVSPDSVEYIIEQKH